MNAKSTSPDPDGRTPPGPGTLAKTVSTVFDAIAATSASTGDAAADGAGRVRAHAGFRTALAALMQDTRERPFICDGSPLAARVFLVGFNPATRLEQPFWSFWDDATGFDRARFMTAYAQTRALRGVRPRLNAMVAALRPVVALETNICALPTPRASDLTKADRRTAIFRFLLESIRPRVLFLHSNEPIAYVRSLMEAPDVDLPELVVVPCRVLGSPMHVCAAPGPLWRRRGVDLAAVAASWDALLGR